MAERGAKSIPHHMEVAAEAPGVSSLPTHTAPELKQDSCTGQGW